MANSIFWLGILFFATLGFMDYTEYRDHELACAELTKANIDSIARGEFTAREAIESLRRNGCYYVTKS